MVFLLLVAICIWCSIGMITTIVVLQHETNPLRREDTGLILFAGLLGPILLFVYFKNKGIK